MPDFSLQRIYNMNVHVCCYDTARTTALNIGGNLQTNISANKVSIALTNYITHVCMYVLVVFILIISPELWPSQANLSIKYIIIINYTNCDHILASQWQCL